MENQKSERSTSNEPLVRLSECRSEFMKQLSRVNERIDHLNDCLTDLLGHSVCDPSVSSSQTERSIVDENNNENDNLNSITESTGMLDCHSQALIRHLGETNEAWNATGEIIANFDESLK